MTVTIDEVKADLRAAARRRRKAAWEGDAEAGAAVRDRFLATLTPRAGIAISAYWPIGSELDTQPLMAALHARGHRLALPVLQGRGRPLLFRAWAPGEPLVKAGFGLSEPAADRDVLVPALLIVPLLAFDRRGYRLGYGGGFYDRTLAGLRAASPAGEPIVAVGVAFAAQALPEVPVTGTDEALDWVITETESIRRP